MSHFWTIMISQERHGSKMAFLDGAPPERLCQPMVDYFTARGGQIIMNARIKDIVLNNDGSVKHYALTNGQIVEGDVYMSAMPGAIYFSVAKQIPKMPRLKINLPYVFFL